MDWKTLLALVVKNLPANVADARDGVQSLGWEDPLEEEMATTQIFLPGKIPWTEVPGRLESMGCKESDMTERLLAAAA